MTAMEIKFKDIDSFKKLLVKKGFSQTKLAREAEVTQPYLNSVINGKRVPGIKFCEKVCTALDMEFDELFVIERKKEEQPTDDFPFCFLPLTATKLGLHEAIIIQIIIQGQDKNRFAEDHFKDGYYWADIEEDEWETIFPFFSQKEINSTLSKLIKLGIVVQDKYYFRIDEKALESAKK